MPDPQAEETFLRSRLTHRRDGRHGELRRHHEQLLAIRRRHAAELGTGWPEVAVDGTAVTLRRPGLTVAVNLGPAPAGGLPPWGWTVAER